MAVKVLLVEDEPNVLMAEAICLEDAGYEVTTASDGLEALNKAFSSPPDLILLDALLPGMGGILALQALKADHRTRHIPVIIVSARAQAQDIETAMKAGANGYITKPFFPSDLLEQVKRLSREGGMPDAADSDSRR